MGRSYNTHDLLYSIHVITNRRPEVSTAFDYEEWPFIILDIFLNLLTAGIL